VLTAAVGYEKELLHNLTVTLTARDGRPAGAGTSLGVWALDGSSYVTPPLTGGTATVQVRPGRYMVWSSIATRDEPGRVTTELTAAVKPELTVAGDAVVTLDARAAKPVTVTVPRLVETLSLANGIYRRVGTRFITLSQVAGDVKLSVLPSEPVTDGDLEFAPRLELEAPQLTMRIAKGGVALHPRHLVPATEPGHWPEGDRTLPAVFAGAGQPDDFAGRDVRGKVALVRSTPELAVEDQVAAAAAAKAAMVVVLAGETGVFQPYVNPAVALPVVGLPKAEGADLLRRLARGPVSLALTGTPSSPYRFDVVLPYRGRLPDGIAYTADASNTALQHSDLYAVRPGQIGAYSVTYSRPGGLAGSGALVVRRPFPLRQDRYLSAGGTRYGQYVYADFPYEVLVGLGDEPVAGAETRRTWFKGPLRPGTGTARPPAARSGDQMLLTFDSFVDAEPDHVLGDQGLQTAARVYRDGQLVAQEPTGVGYVTVGTAEPATYRVELDVAKGRPDWAVSTEAHSAWTFRSARPAEPGWTPLPVLTATWDLDLDPANAAAAGRDFPLRLLVRNQTGVPVTAGQGVGVVRRRGRVDGGPPGRHRRGELSRVRAAPEAQGHHRHGLAAVRDHRRRWRLAGTDRLPGLPAEVR
jgi:hypothetical protein